jgi:hypothetical protein
MNASGTTGHLDVSGVFDAAGEIFKRSFGSVWIVALILLIPAEIIAGLLGDSGILGFIGTLIHWVAVAWLAGSVVRIVQDVELDGTVDQGVGEILGSVTPQLVSIILLQIVVGILVGIGTIFFIIPGVILALMWCVAVPSMVVEKLGVFDSMSRSSDLTRDNRMRILSIGLLIFLALIGIAMIVVFLSLVSWLIGAIAGIVLGVIIYPYVSILAAVLYFRLVEVKEGGAPAVAGETAIVEETADPGAPPPVV